MVNLNIRIDENLNADVEDVLSRLGLTTSDAVRLFFAQIRNTRSIPFMLKLYDEPNTELQTAMKRADDYIAGKDTQNFCKHSNINSLKALVDEKD